MISPRLDMILQNVKGSSVADIGTDHAFIPIALAKRGVRVIATDANSGPLLSAKRNIEKRGLNITLLQGFGLDVLTAGDTEEIILAGMGGDLIKTIITNGMEKALASRLILQPMNSQAELRQFLIENGFEIASEDLAKEERKVYNLIVAKAGKTELPDNEIDLHLPPILYNHPLFPMLIEKKEREFKKQFIGLSNSKNANSTELKRLENLLSCINKLKEREL
ncbi:MAG: class I SAM-dependent methyltransferase [Firmicutes bacterium]|nr:class I SAM-dependent methyltransferase [Bacillota bacterium]